MICAIVILVLLVLCLSPGLVITAGSSQVQMTNVKVLERGDDSQCPSMEERERARSEVTLTANQVIASVTNTYTCNGKPGWRRVTYINMTDTSYNCPAGLNLTSYTKRTCAYNCRVLFNHI